PTQLSGGTINKTVVIKDIINGSMVLDASGNSIGRGFKVEILDDGQIMTYEQFVAAKGEDAAQKAGVDYLFTFGVRLGYEIKEVLVNFKNTNLEQMQAKLVSYGDGRYWWRYGMLINENGQWENPRFGLALFGEAYEVNVVIEEKDGGTTVKVVKPGTTETHDKGSIEITVGHVTNKATGKYSITDRNTPDKGDMVVFSLKPSEGCYIDLSDANIDSNVKIYFMNGTTKQYLTHIGKDDAWNPANYEYKFTDGFFSFVMPNGIVYVEANFLDKPNVVVTSTIDGKQTVKIYKEQEDGSKEESSVSEVFTLSENRRVANGEEFTVKLTDEALSEGWRFFDDPDDQLDIPVNLFGIDGANKDDMIDDIKASLLANNYKSFTVKIRGLIPGTKPEEPGIFGITEVTLKRFGTQVTYEIIGDTKDDAEKAGCSITGTGYADQGDTVKVSVSEADATDKTPAYGFDSDSLVMEITITGDNNSERIVGLAAKANNDGTFSFTVPKDLNLDAAKNEKIASMKVTGEFVPGKKNGTKLTIGTGIAVTILNQTSASDIKDGRTIAVNGLTVESANAVTAKTEAFAGFSSGNFGFAGAISVQVGNVKASSTISKGFTPDSITIGTGELNVTSTSQESVTVNADSTGSKASGGKNVGVGAAVATDVFNGNVESTIKDGAKIVNKTDGSGDKTTISAITVSADQNRDENVSSKAGAAGGKSFVPDVTVAFTYANASATFGKGHDTSKLNADTVSVLATAALSRALTADAAAEGESVGLGGSFSVSVIKDSTKSKLSRNVNATNVYVRAKEKSTVTSNAKAGAQGATSPSRSGKTESSDDEGPDQQAAGIIGGAAGLGGNGVNGAELNQQKAETPEGTITVAAAFVLNIQKSYIESFISEGTDITASGDVVVESLALLDTRVNANGSATKSKNGIGVAVAVNAVNYENLAHIDKSKVEAGNLTVTAGVIQPDRPVPQPSVPENNPEDDNYLVSIVKEWIKDLSKKLVEEAGLSKTLAGYMEDILNTIIE
ncbi:MAG: hypothetical protein HUJ75_02430, partial [Parasporobacterium sp.]|nr:hypothetical protein [Parasporobacterium sp.]